MIQAYLLSIVLALQAKPPFYDEVQNLIQKDNATHPAKGQILFAGSSSFTRWPEAETSFPGYAILNRGFGGSRLVDLTYFAKDVIFKHEPKQIVIYCGENDFAWDDQLPAYKVEERFKTLFKLIRGKMPQVPIAYVSMKPSPSRQQFWSKMIAANGWIKDYLATQKKTAFIDVWPLMLNPDGSAKTEIFLEDMLHMNAKGYAIWIQAIKPVLVK